MHQVNQESLKAPQTKNTKRKPRSRAKAERKSKRRREEERREKKRSEEQKRNRGGERSEADRRAEKRRAEKTDERRNEKKPEAKRREEQNRKRKRRTKQEDSSIRKPQAPKTLNRSSPKPATSSETSYFARRTGAQTSLHKEPGQGSKTHTMELRWEKCVKHWKYGHQSSPAGICRGPSYPQVAPPTDQAVCSKMSFFSHATRNCQDQSPRRSALVKRIDVGDKVFAN